jgi:hypothetical protein
MDFSKINFNELNYSQIAEGWTKAIIGAKNEDRANICNTCPNNNNGQCQICGCILSAKQLVKDSPCPQNKWDDIKCTQYPYGISVTTPNKLPLIKQENVFTISENTLKLYNHWMCDSKLVIVNKNNVNLIGNGVVLRKQTGLTQMLHKENIEEVASITYQIFLIEPNNTQYIEQGKDVFTIVF